MTNKSTLRQAADWWGLLPDSEVERLHKKHNVDKSVAEMSAQDVLDIWELEFAAECNDCDWKGPKDDLNDEEEDEGVFLCPNCGGENIYYNR